MKSTKELEEDFAKKSNKIVYSPKIFENQPQINFYKAEEIKEDGISENIGVFILKYEINGISQEVIIAKLKNTNRAFEKARDIKDLIESQLRENLNNQKNFHYFRQLKKFVHSNRLAFELTMEGTDIITYSGIENIDVRRTYYEETNTYKNSYIQCLYTPEKMQEFAKERKSNNQKLLNKLDLNEKWKKRRELILKLQSTDEDKKLFLKGEKISNIIEETDDEYILNNYKDTIADYLMENYEMYGNSNDEQEKNNVTQNLTEYLQVKEKGIAIDIKILIEKIQNKFEESMLKQSMEGMTEKEELDQARTLNTLNNYGRFFDLIKSGRDLNARILALRLVHIDFEVMERLLARVTDDKEMLEYIKLKAEEIKEIQVAPKLEYEDYSKGNVKELNEFLLHSSTRKYTKEDDEQILLDTFDSMKVELIKNNVEALKKYNYYAEKNGLYACPLPEEKKTKAEEQKKTKQMPKTLQSMYEISDEEFYNVINPILPNER